MKTDVNDVIILDSDKHGVTLTGFEIIDFSVHPFSKNFGEVPRSILESRDSLTMADRGGWTGSSSSVWHVLEAGTGQGFTDGKRLIRYFEG